MKKDRVIALLWGRDRPGLVAQSANWIFDRGGNIIHADQHRDEEETVFFQRLEWQPHSKHTCENEIADFVAIAQNEWCMEALANTSSFVPRIVLFVSKTSHCLHDVLLRCRSGELQAKVVAVISNHMTLKDDTKYYGVPFHHISVTQECKRESEIRQLEIIHEMNPDLMVLARYMQVLSGEFLSASECPIINIHHSFLPAFAGRKPYHQAYSRGVKIIGATAHYVTEDLDQGPIIAQDVCPINHRNSVNDLIRKGRDLEKQVFAQAIRWHIEKRVLAYNNKTVVFD